jgi:hypothetical protein
MLAGVLGVGVGLALGAVMFSGGGGQIPVAATTPPPCPEPPSASAALAATTPSPSAPGVSEVAEPIEPESPQAEAAAAQPPSDPPPGGLGLGRCKLRITSLPPGAAVSVEGTAAGKTPTLVEGAPCAKAVAVALEKDRFAPWQKKVTARNGKLLKVHATLRRPDVKLEVASTPPGATVMVNGRSQGKTPATVEAPAYSRVVIKLVLAGYKTDEQVVQTKLGKPNKVAATLEKEPKPVAKPSKPTAPANNRFGPAPKKR